MTAASTRRLMAGAEPFEHPGPTDVGALLVHGFTGSPFEMRPVGQALAERGIGSSGPLLRGHGTHPRDLAACRYTDWVADVEAALDRLLERHDRAVIVGLSMGGTLALNVGARRAADPRVVGLVTIGATLFLGDWRLRVVDLLHHLIRWQAWGKPAIKDRRAWDGFVGYRRIRTSAIPQLLQLMHETDRRLAQVHQPLLIVHAHEDRVVPPGNAAHIRARVSSRDVRLLMLDNCYHVITVDFGADQVNAEIVRFCERFRSAERPTVD